jgi:hypothetical protein
VTDENKQLKGSVIRIELEPAKSVGLIGSVVVPFRFRVPNQKWLVWYGANLKLLNWLVLYDVVRPWLGAIKSQIKKKV